MTETRKINSNDLRSLCIRKGWYTRGTNEEYAHLLKMADDLEHVRSRNIVGLAENIVCHSEIEPREYSLATICFEIAEICHSFFE